MAIGRIVFHQIRQDTQDYSSFRPEEDHMVSRIDFSLDVGGRLHEGLFVEVRQPYGTDFESNPIEVGPVLGPYSGPWNHAGFHPLCEAYYRDAVGRSGSALRIAHGASVRMRDNLFRRQLVVELSIPEEGLPSW